MTETEYRKLLIDSVCAGEYPEKDALPDLLKISSLRFEKQMRLRGIYGIIAKSIFTYVSFRIKCLS